MSAVSVDEAVVPDVLSDRCSVYVLYAVSCDRVNIGEQAVRVAQNLPTGYLSAEQTTPGRPVCSSLLMTDCCWHS